MYEVTSQISLRGNVAKVFDLITTARHWTEWHPATLTVGGVTRRPMALGDTITEWGRIGEHTYDPTWTVIAHEPASRVVLSAGKGRIQIRYAFGVDEQLVRFTRTMAFQPSVFRGDAELPSLVATL